MSETKWTPGPWEVRQSEGGNNFIHHSALREDPRVCYVYGDFAECPAPEAAANARLIASAPELLEALRFCRDHLRELVDEDDSIGNLALLKARDALAKAEGR